MTGPIFYTTPDGEQMQFSDQSRLERYFALINGRSGSECAPARTENAKKQKRSRSRHAKALNFWRVRIRTGSKPLFMIKGVSDTIIEQERVKATRELKQMDSFYPERVEVIKLEVQG